jgi:hypothetical protein
MPAENYTLVGFGDARLLWGDLSTLVVSNSLAVPAARGDCRARRSATSLRCNGNAADLIATFVFDDDLTVLRSQFLV